jgi:hypothetical protein
VSVFYYIHCSSQSAALCGNNNSGCISNLACDATLVTVTDCLYSLWLTQSTSSGNQTCMLNIHIFYSHDPLYYTSRHIHAIDALLLCEVLWVQIQNFCAPN